MSLRIFETVALLVPLELMSGVVPEALQPLPARIAAALLMRCRALHDATAPVRALLRQFAGCWFGARFPTRNAFAAPARLPRSCRSSVRAAVQYQRSQRGGPPGGG